MYLFVPMRQYQYGHVFVFAHVALWYGHRLLVPMWQCEYGHELLGAHVVI